MLKPFNYKLFLENINSKYRKIIHKRSDQLPKKLSENAPFPKNCLVEISNSCNHECIFCNSPRMERRLNKLNEKTYEKFISQSVQHGMEEVGLYSTGEPFMSKNLNWFIKTAKENGIKRVYITTNGSLASIDKVKSAKKAGLDSIKFSINSATKENYLLVHGKNDFDKVTQNISNIFKWKKDENIDLEMLGSFIYTDKTKHEIDLFKKTFDKYLLATMIIPAGTQGGRFNSDIKKISTPSRVKKSKDDIHPCSFLWDRIILTCEGYITACAVDYELDLVYADFRNSELDISEIWNNNIIKELRKKHLNKDLNNLVCKNCLYGTNDAYKKIMNVSYEKKRNEKNEKKVTDRMQDFQIK